MINKDWLYQNLNQGLLEERLKAFRWNLDKNLEWIARFGGLKRITPFLAGRNVIIAGAGPSLEGCYDILREKKNRKGIIIISADMAMLPLVKNGITPDYVISCETTPVDFFDNAKTERMHLIAFSCMSNINVRKWRGEISFYNWMLFDPLYLELWKTAGTQLGYLATGSIIITQAVSFALGCGVGSLALIGNDLAFGDRFYARDSVPHRKRGGLCDRFSVFPSMEMDISRKRREYEIRRGDDVFYTNSQFLAAKTWLEDLFSRHGFPVYDCSMPGCSGRNIIKTGLEDFFAQLNAKARRNSKRR